MSSSVHRLRVVSFLAPLALVACATASDPGGGTFGPGDTAIPVDSTSEVSPIDSTVTLDSSTIDTNAPPLDSATIVDSMTTDTGGDAASDDTATTTDVSVSDALVPSCPATTKTAKIAELNDPLSSKKGTSGEGVVLTAVVATSPKFLVSKSKTTMHCLYGVFLADANTTFAPYSGILVVSRGNDATTSGTTTKCSDGDLIPNDTMPGDVFTATGKYELFGPTSTSCAPAAVPTPAKAPQLGALCALTRSSTGGATPAPLDVTPADLIGGSDVVLKYSAGLVRVKRVKAKTATTPGDTTFGTFTLDPSGLSVTDTVYFRGPSTAPTVTVGQSFTTIVGESYLDFCSWTLAPRSMCDLSPPPGDAGVCP